MLSSFLGAASFLTSIPAGGTIKRSSVLAFPVVGLLLGGLLGVIMVGAVRVFHPLVVGALIVGADALLTGFLHLDAVGDAGDGLIAHMEKTKRLEVMEQPLIGAFGVVAIVIIELLRFASLTKVSQPLVTLVICYGMSRGLMGLGLLVAKSAKGNSILELFSITDIRFRYAMRSLLVVELAAIVFAGYVAVGERILIGAVVSVLLFTFVIARAYRVIGGITGDVIGAAGMLSEVGFLISVFGVR